MKASALFLAAVAVTTWTVDATAAPVASASPLKVALSCHIANAKIVVITNSTAGAIAAGTQMGYDAIRSGDGKHYGKTFGGPLLPPGASLQLGTQPSASCTAWYYRRLLMNAR